MKIYINTDNNELLSNVNSTNPKQSTDLVFFQDTEPFLDILLLKAQTNISIADPYQNYGYTAGSDMKVGFGVINYSSSILLTSSSLQWNTSSLSWTGSIVISGSNVNTALLDGSRVIMQLNHLSGSYTIPLFYQPITVAESLIK
jgi:hypothetical protein